MSRNAVCGITLMMLSIGMLTLTSIAQPAKAEPRTWYVDDDGGADFARIQDAIDGANPGDTIYVYNGTYYENVAVNKTDLTLIGENRDEAIIDGDGTGTVVQITAKDVKINGFTIRNGGPTYFGVSLYYSSDNVLTGNNITNNYESIYLFYSSNNTLSSNNVTNNYAGISLYNAFNNTLSDNNITNNFNYGIHLSDSSNNVVSGNTVTNNYWYGVYLGNASSNTLFGNIVSNNGEDGILLEVGSNNNSLSSNNITNNNSGICLYCSSNYNTISGNNITDNTNGIRVASSSLNNSIYHSNFVGNTQQVVSYESTNLWDDGYPSGGNYWSDYTIRYPDAKELDDSGIWDTSYEIDENNQDKYPLIEPWTPPPPIPTTIDELKTEIEELGFEDQIDNQGIVKSLIAKLNVAQKLIDKGKIDEAKTVLENFIKQVQNLSGIHITAEAVDILIESAEYIISHL